MWFNLNFEGESREEIDFRESKTEIWKATNILANTLIEAYKKMEKDQKDILTKPWWERTRFADFATKVVNILTKKPQLKDQMRKMFADQKEKLSYFDFFQFLETTMGIKLANWEEDALESRLDRLGMAFIEFNEWNEFTMEFGMNWGEELLETDLEDVLDAKLNLSYKDYKLSKLDYFSNCPTMLTSEKAALAKVDSIYQAHKLKTAQGQNTRKFLDVDFGPQRASDVDRNRFALYKNGEVPMKGLPEPADVEWVYPEVYCGKTPVQFVDDGAASADCI